MQGFQEVQKTAIMLTGLQQFPRELATAERQSLEDRKGLFYSTLRLFLRLGLTAMEKAVAIKKSEWKDAHKVACFTTLSGVVAAISKMLCSLGLAESSTSNSKALGAYIYTLLQR